MVTLDTILTYELFDVDRIPYAGAAIVLSVVVGLVAGALRVPALPFLCLAFNSSIGVFGARLDRKQRPKADLLFRGFVLLVFSGVLFAFLGRIFDDVSKFYVTEILFLSLCLASGSVFALALRVFYKKTTAQPDVSKSTHLNLSKNDGFVLTRETLAFLARSFDKMLVAPIIFYIIGGLPIVCIYIYVIAMAWRFGKNGFSKGFGTFALWIERLLGIVPSLAAAFLIAVAALLAPKVSPMRASVAFLNIFKYMPYHQGGGALTVFAHALNVKLGGAVSDLSGSAIKNEWVGPNKASAKVPYSTLQQGLYLIVMAHLVFLLVLGLIYVGVDGVFGHIVQITSE